MQNKTKLVLWIRPDKKPTLMKQGYVKDNQFVGQTIDVHVMPPKQWIANGYMAYVVKEVDNGKYNGKFQWSDSSDPNAEQIDVRWLRNCNSLDKQWQTDNKRDANMNDEELVGWEFISGAEYEVDETTERRGKMWIELLKHHEDNGSNPHRDQTQLPLFVEIDAVKEVEKKRSDFSERKKLIDEEEAILENDERVDELSKLFNLNIELQDVDTRRHRLIEAMKNDTKGFFEIIDSVNTGAKRGRKPNPKQELELEKAV